MWYVIQVFTGDEEKIVRMCDEIVGICDCEGSVLQKCFIPYALRKRRYCGGWHMEKKPLFPGYVFLTSSEPEVLFLSLKRVPGLTRLLGTGEEIVPLSAGEEKFLIKLGGEKQIVESSIGVIENDQIIITSGPLLGMEGCIRKIDRHKRAAWLEVRMMGRTIEAQVGLEVVEKKNK